MASPALTATALRYGLNPKAASSLSDAQLRRFIAIRKRSGGQLGPKPRPVKPKPVPLPPILGGRPDPITQALKPGRNREIQQQHRETIRRQQLLRQNGYPVVVDGVWGPRSQAAWNRYRKHRSVVEVDPPGSKPKQALPFTDPQAEVKRKQQQFQAAQQQKAERDQLVKEKTAARLADARLAKQRALIIGQAKALRDNPRIAAKMTLKQLTSVLTDKETGFDLATSNVAASAIQIHLRAHGYNVKVTGRPDQQTFTVLKTAFRDSDRREKRKRLRAIHDKVYAPLGLEPGEKRQGFPLATVPTLGELDTILQEGGFTADRVMRYFNREVVTGFDAWDTARWRQLSWIAEKRNPFYGLKGKFSKGLQPNHLDTLMALAAPFDYVGDANISEKDKQLEQFKGETTWDTQLHTILTSASPDEMKKRLLAYDAVNEQKFKRKQAELAEQKSFWGNAFDKLLVPGEQSFTAATLATTRIIQEGARLTGTDAGERDVSWEDAQIILGYAKPGDYPGYDNLAQKASGWLTVPGSLVIDPLNFVAPFKAASTLARFGRGGSSLGKWGVKGETLWSKGLVYEKGTWSKAALARSIPGAATLEATKSGQMAVAFGKKLTADKDKALAIVRGRVSQAARHGFAPVNKFAKAAIKTRAPKNLAEVQERRAVVRAWLENPDNPEAHGIIKELQDAQASMYLDAPRSTASNVGASFLANMAEKVRVLAGHQFATEEALRMIDDLRFEEIRENVDKAFRAVDQIKADSGYDELRTQTNAAFDRYAETKNKSDLATALNLKSKLNEAKALHKEELDYAQQLNAQKKRVQQEISDGYTMVVEAAGTYIKGGALKEGGQLYARQILARTLQKMDAVEDTIIPVLQDIIESYADVAFAAAKSTDEVTGIAARNVDEATGEAVTHPLWDENGLWAGRNGAEAQALRERAARAFDPENLADVPNPAYKIGHTGDEMFEAIQFEVKRGLPRIFNYAHREAMRLGDEFTFDANAAAEKLEQDIIKSWEHRPDNLFYDTRETVQVNKLYARNFNEVAEGFAKDLKDYLDGNGALDLPGLERIAAGAPKGVADGFDDSWNGLLWQLGSRFKSTPGMEMKLAEDTTRRKYAPRVPEEITNQKAGIAWLNKERARLAEFGSAVASHRVQLAIASDDLMPGQLSRDLLFMRALAVHQAKWAKGVYLALNGFLKLWKFATLPLRTGWVVRNQVDNFAKAMVRSVRDPRFLLLGAENPRSFVAAGRAAEGGLDAVRTVFDIGITPLRGAIRLFDGLFNTKALDEFDKLLEIFWNFPSEILTKFFDLAAIPAPPQSVLDSSRFSKQLEDWRSGSRASSNVSLDDYMKAGIKPPLRLQKSTDKQAYETMMNHGNPTAAQRLAYKMRKTPDALWDLMGNRPENYFKRVIYRSELKKELSQLGRQGITGVEAQMRAHEKAWDAVVDTLFDYGKLSVVEDNLRVFMPFIQFWRKNTAFWIQTGVNKPWLPLAVLKLDQQRRMAHDDLPEWMQRYFHVNEIVDAAAVIPGLDTVIRAILPEEQMTDPTSFLSFTPLHRVFRDLVYGENQFLPPEDRARGVAGMIIGPIVEAMDEWGLGLNPVVRKPMEYAGLINSRDWQAVFPQTTLAEAFTLKFWGEDAMFRVAQWERVFTLGFDVHADKIAQNFDYYVNREMTGQMIAGETIDRSTAEATVKATIWTQALWGYFGGTYWRTATPEDIYVAKLQDDLRMGQIDFEDLSDKEKQVLSVWSKATGGAEAFDRYLAHTNLIQAFYKEPDFEARAEMLKDYPALSEYVDMQPIARTVGKNWIKNAQRYTDTARYFNAVKFADAVDAAPAQRELAFEMFVTPDLEKFWAKNDTDIQMRNRMVKGEIHRSMNSLQNAYFKIPENDYEARDGFLKEHPELTRHWQKHNDPSDNYQAIMGGVKADLRNLYFHVLETKGFEAAAPILKQFPFMFEGTKSEKKIRDGEWIVGYGKRGWNDARRNAWRQVAAYARWFFDTYMEKVGSEKAFDWLREQAATNPQAKALLDYFAKYSNGGGSGGSRNWSPERRAAWAKVAKFSRWFFDFYLPKVGADAAWAWLRKQEGLEARQFMAYVDRYSTKEGGGKFSPERRSAYLAVKPFMSWFFDSYMPKVGEKRAWEWLRNSNDPQAKAMVDYLAKYGKHSQKSIDYRKAKHWLTLYFDLPEDERQAWLSGDSEGAKTVRWYFDKYANESDMTQHGKDYRAAKGDLKAYFALPKEQRTAWLNSGSPQATAVLAYFKKYGKAHQYEREFKKLVAEFPALSQGTPEQSRRISFWKQYFALSPEQRPAFVLKNAEDYGIFIYGDLSETVRFDQEAEYDRRAVGLGISERAADFLYVRPLLNYYQTLSKENKQLFLKANPELQDYFDQYTTYSPTGDKKLDLLVERYFLMPENSALRSQMLKEHPELQDYFDAKASPAMRAMRAVLEQYFTIKNPNARKDFLLMHPEIRDYFDARKAERNAAAEQMGAFEQADPRLRPYFKDNEDMRRSADMMARKLHKAAISSLEETTRELQLRRQRQPAR